MGTPPSSITVLRRQAASSVAGKGPGRCLTTTLSLWMGDQDPAISLRVQLVRAWIDMWTHSPHLHERIVRSWPRVRSHLGFDASKRWRRVRGPIGALQATLLDVGWLPVAACEWRRPVGDSFEVWQFPDPPPEEKRSEDVFDFSDLLDDLREDISSSLWGSAASHEFGDGLARGADVIPIRLEMRRAVREGAYDKVGQIVTVVSGGQWPQQRQVDAGYLAPPLCPRCGTAPETLFHRIWECPRNRGPAFEASEFLFPQALAGQDQLPSLWLRGLPPSSLTTPSFVDGRGGATVWTVGRAGDEDDDECPLEPDLLAQAWRDDQGFLVAFGDGSGGQFSSDVRRRRVGAAAVVMELTPQGLCRLGGAACGLDGRRQTVPRAEMRAFALALASFSGPLLYVTDSTLLLRGWEQGLHLSGGGTAPNADLWRLIRHAFLAHEGEVRVIWTPSHVDPSDGTFSTWERRMAEGNGAADELASRAARRAWNAALEGKAPPTDVWDCTAALVRRRACQAFVEATQAAPWTAERPSSASAPSAPPLQRALLSSSHCFVRAARHWACALCHQLVNRSCLVEACASPCSAVAGVVEPHPADVIRAAGSEVWVGGIALHPSRRLQLWPRHSLYFCSRCGFTATTDPRQLAGVCGVGDGHGVATRKGRENLARIQKGLHPGRRVPDAAVACDEGRVAREAALRRPPGVLWPDPPAA